MILKLRNQNPGLYFSKILRGCKGTRTLPESFHVTRVSGFKGTICQLPALTEDRYFEQGKKCICPRLVEENWD